MESNIFIHLYSYIDGFSMTGLKGRLVTQTPVQNWCFRSLIFRELHPLEQMRGNRNQSNHSSDD